MVLTESNMSFSSLDLTLPTAEDCSSLATLALVLTILQSFGLVLYRLERCLKVFAVDPLIQVLNNLELHGRTRGMREPAVGDEIWKWLMDSPFTPYTSNRFSETISTSVQTYLEIFNYTRTYYTSNPNRVVLMKRSEDQDGVDLP